MRVICFSKDRAMQLHAFLRSYAQHVTPQEPVHVLYRTSSERHHAAYAEVFALFEKVAVPHLQTIDFRHDVLRLMPVDGHVVFFVDDMIFIRPWTITEMPGLSLRLGVTLTRCYVMDCEQALPPFEWDEHERVMWRWSNGNFDWAYPLSLDGHVFNANEMSDFIEQIDFDSPNQFESALQQFVPIFKDRFGVCFKLPRVVNVPWNSVQNGPVNRFSPTAHSDVDGLLEQWEQGRQIDLGVIASVPHVSVHQPCPLRFEARVLVGAPA